MGGMRFQLHKGENTMDQKVKKECSAVSNGEVSFPEVIQRLTKMGVESYYTDLVSDTKIYYCKNDSFAVSCFSAPTTEIASTFHKEGVAKAVEEVRARKINYSAFLERIMQAGVLCYMVFVKGEKTIYFGRKGEQHVEDFFKL